MEGISIDLTGTGSPNITLQFSQTGYGSEVQTIGIRDFLATVNGTRERTVRSGTSSSTSAATRIRVSRSTTRSSSSSSTTSSHTTVVGRTSVRSTSAADTRNRRLSQAATNIGVPTSQTARGIPTLRRPTSVTASLGAAVARERRAAVSEAASRRSRPSIVSTAATLPPASSGMTRRETVYTRTVPTLPSTAAAKTTIQETQEARKKLRSRISEESYTFGRLFCPVCFCDLLKPAAAVQTINCGHVFCLKCITHIKFADILPRCPTCRNRIETNHPIYLPIYEED